MPDDYALLAAALGVAALAGVAHPCVRRALLGGLRCMGRYPDLWKIPAACGVAYACFQTVATAFLLMRSGDGFAGLAWADALRFDGSVPGAADVARGAWLTAAENLAGIFNTFSLTFPLSALAAVYFIFNAGGLLAEFSKAVRRRLPRCGFAVTAGFFVCAACAVLKPAVYLMLPEFNRAVPGGAGVLAAAGVNLGSFVFEFVFGVCLQIYLVLMAFAWIRGIRVDRERLLHFAVRRLGVVIKWSFVLLLLITGLVAAPMLADLAAGPLPWGVSGFAFADAVGRPLVAAVMLVTCGVQVTLVFHNERLRGGIADGLRFVARNAVAVVAFGVFGLAPFFALSAAGFVVAGSAAQPIPVVEAWRAVAYVLQAGVAGWLIASWVCLYRARTSGRRDILF